ncbi:NLR family CARD domain-containing protein 3-like [Halichondria panicea]|uniref:NLR family CARD domain-containing protein 3-like n=1 Tax=Halichondria panicea TaxID=6063 RepID=UPI00312B500A
MATQDFKTTAAKAFLEHYDKLVDSIQEADLPVLGARFFCRQIISRETMEMVGNVSTLRALRVSKLMLTVMAHLDVHPDKFESALDVFREELVYTEVASMISLSFGNIPTDSQHSPTVLTASPKTAIGKYADYRKNVYLRSKLPHKGKWPPAPCKKIIKLATIEIEDDRSHLALCKLNRSESIDEYMKNNSMNSISMEDLLTEKDGSLPKVVIIQGVPGIGKSTFAWKFCRKWAKGKIYQQYDLVVLLRMRDTRVREATKLSNLFFSEDADFSNEVAKAAVSNSGKGILLLMEGIDELPASCLADGMPLSNLLQGESLPLVTIIVTSRPWAVQTLEEKFEDQISRQVEILGFTREDILRYISHAFTEEEKTEFLEYLRSHPQLESIMHIPLNAAFVVQIYKQFRRSQQAIPSTLTQLYTALVEGLLLRYIKSVPEFDTLKIISVSSLPEPVQTHFHQLCLLAFMSFTKLTVQVTFTDSEAALYECFDFLGLMQSSTELTINTSTTVSHSFLHFTIQEFLAAYHLSKQPSQVQELFLEIHSKDPQFSMLITFLVGLNSSVLHCIKLPESKIQDLSTFHLHLLYETQYPKDVCKFLGNMTMRYYPALTSTSLDLHALSYCLCSSNCHWDLKISLRNFSSLFRISDEFYKGHIINLEIMDASRSNLQLFFSLPKRLFSDMYRLVIRSCEPVESVVGDILSDSRLTNLKQFSLLNKSLQVSCNLSLIMESLFASHPNFVHIGLGNTVISSSDMAGLCKYMSFRSQSGSPELTLGFIQNSIGSESLRLLISAVAFSNILTHLVISFNHLSIDLLEMLSVALSANSSLQTLGLDNCLIDGEGAELLSTGLEENRTLLGLDLRRNPINVNGAAALASMLTMNTSLKILYLSHNKQIGHVGALRLISALQNDNKTLAKLSLPAEYEPIEYESILMDDIRNSGRIEFINNTNLVWNTIAHEFTSFDIWPYE